MRRIEPCRCFAKRHARNLLEFFRELPADDDFALRPKLRNELYRKALAKRQEGSK